MSQIFSEILLDTPGQIQYHTITMGMIGYTEARPAWYAGKNLMQVAAYVPAGDCTRPAKVGTGHRAAGIQPIL